MYEQDKRVVMTLDAGGTNFVFSAIQGYKVIVDPITMPAITDNLHGCLLALVDGFEKVREQLTEKPVAISFAFPGPADYRNGIIGDLPNFPCFRGGVAVGPFLQEHFGIPVFINNDADLFTFGEALAGALPDLNKAIAVTGSSRQFGNVIGITLGTGFGCGVVIDLHLLAGDNGCAGEIWNFRNKIYPDMIVEEGVSIRAVKRFYQKLSGESAANLTPKDIFEIAEGTQAGNMEAAKDAFAFLGSVAGNAVAEVLGVVDGLIVLGGGVAGAYKYIVPAMIEEFNAQLKTFAGESFRHTVNKVYDLTDMTNLPRMLEGASVKVKVPIYDKEITYHKEKRTAIVMSVLGTLKATAIGAYVYALKHLDEE